MFIADTESQFKKLFVSRLKDMLSEDALGAFILVLANSRQDAFLQEALAEEIERIYSLLKEKACKHKLAAPADDVDVFNRLSSLALENIPVWQSRAVGEWQVNCNTLRQFRPARAASQKFTSIKQPFDEKKFHFNKVFLQAEILWQGEYKNKQLRVLYNKFPFSDYHLLIAFAPQENKPQLLTQELHDINGILLAELINTLPGFGIGFNSLAAGASVNHLHCQGFIRQQIFPIESDHWQHNGGDEQYPLPVKRFSDSAISWKYIDQLQQQNVAFNCLYRNHYCYVITRKYQGSVVLPEWLAGAGWLDVAGVMTVSDKKTYDTLEAVTISDALSLMA